MDLHKEWAQLNEKLFSNQSLINEEIMSAITSESNSAIEKIKRGLTIKSYWCLFFIVGFFTLMFINRDSKDLMIAIGIINAIYIIGYLMISRLANKMNIELEKEGSILATLKRNQNLFKKATNFERNFFVFLTPVIVISASAYRGIKSDGVTFQALMHDSSFLKFSLFACVLSVPFVYFVGHFLNKRSFQPYIDQLQENIQKLEGVEFLKTIT